MKEKLKELEERLERVEEAIFGFTYVSAHRYLEQVNENIKGLHGMELDNYLSRSMETIAKAEKCVGA